MVYYKSSVCHELFTAVLVIACLPAVVESMINACLLERIRGHIHHEALTFLSLCNIY